MNAVIRALVIFVILLGLMRIAGRRTLGELTPFDFILLLILGETTQQALLGDDFSITNGVLAMSTLLLADIGLSLLKPRHPRLERLLDGSPVLLLRDGELVQDALRRRRIDTDDILAAARKRHGLTRLDQIRWAVLETDGEISIVPADPSPRGSPV